MSSHDAGPVCPRMAPAGVTGDDVSAVFEEEGAAGVADWIRSMVGTAPTDEPGPKRGGAVEAWVKRWRDHQDHDDPVTGPAWEAIDGMLDDLRHRSDIGASWSDQLDHSGMGPQVIPSVGGGATAAQKEPFACAGCGHDRYAHDHQAGHCMENLCWCGSFAAAVPPVADRLEQRASDGSRLVWSRDESGRVHLAVGQCPDRSVSVRLPDTGALRDWLAGETS